MPIKQNNKKFPKVIIIGEALHSKTGTGITLSNFFADWPRDNIAILAGEIIWESDVALCNNYFLWKTKFDLIKRLTTFRLRRQNDNSTEGSISINDILKRQRNEITTTFNYQEQPNRSDLKRVFYYISKSLRQICIFFLNFFGLFPLIKKEFKITPLLDDWITSYNPEVIYTFLNHYEQFQLVLDLHEKYKIPFIVHPADDHIKLMPPKGLFFYYWRYKMNLKFETLLRKASVRLSICDYMSQIYKQRYQLEFFAYHNPIEPEKWLPYSRNNWENNEPFKILYAGRYGFDNASLLHLLSQVIEEMNNEGFNVQLDIRFGAFSDEAGIDTFKKYKNTTLKEYVPHTKMSSVIPKYNLLYFPLGFDNKTKKIYNVSMSTKISEYMISGTPILVHAPKNTAYFQYAKEGQWGYLLNTDKKNDLRKALMELIQDEKLRAKLGSKAKEMAIKNHDAKIIRDNFRLEFVRAANI